MIKMNKTDWFKIFYMSLIIGFVSCNSKNKEEQKPIEDTYAKGELPVQHGMQLFNQHCASCHDFNANVIGPSLGGVTSKVSKEWLFSFIKNPKGMIDKGDERAVSLFKKYNSYMPSFEAISDADLEDVLGYIHVFSEAEKKSKNKRVGALVDPIPAKIPQSDLILEIEEFMTVPPSSETIPKARINKLTAVKTVKGERLFVADLRGKLYEIKDAKTSVYLNLKEEFENFIDVPGWGTGLGSFDFHPEFQKNGLLYTTHTEPAQSGIADFAFPDSIPSKMQWVVTEWQVEDPDLPKFSGNKRELLRADMISFGHGFQEISFNPLAKPGHPDYGLLFLTIGDGSAALSGYPFLCGSPSKLWGSVIRIDPLGNTSKNGNYGIPKDNPFANEPDKLGEIWSYGFRNPHRLSWDASGSGNMLVTNIGQHSVEEVDLVTKGANFGWPYREGTFLYDVDANTEVVYPLPENDEGFSYPVIQFDHDEGNAISGGYVYTGSKISKLQNKYIFGDVPRGLLFYSEASSIKQGQQAPIYKIGLEVNGVIQSLEEVLNGQRVDLRFGKDSAGELFIFTKNDGKIYKVTGCRASSSKAI